MDEDSSERLKAKILNEKLRRHSTADTAEVIREWGKEGTGSSDTIVIVVC